MAQGNDSSQTKIQVVVITGMSGSGKSTALKAFEDMGYYCVDNLPITLLPEFLSLSEKSAEIPTRIALVMDVREKGFLDQYGSIFKQVKDQGFHLEVLFLGASDNVLVQRFSQTRRKHPLQKKGRHQGSHKGGAKQAPGSQGICGQFHRHVKEKRAPAQAHGSGSVFIQG